MYHNVQQAIEHNQITTQELVIGYYVYWSHGAYKSYLKMQEYAESSTTDCATEK